MLTARFCLSSGVLICMLTVVFGAFGAHALKPILSSDSLAIYDTALRYQMFHGLALILSGVLMQVNGLSKYYKTAALFFLLGLLIFCGSLYAMVLSEIVLGERIKVLGAITPIGGVGFILAWWYLLLAINKPTQSDIEKRA